MLLTDFNDDRQNQTLLEFSEPLFLAGPSTNFAAKWIHYFRGLKVISVYSLFGDRRFRVFELVMRLIL
jgi:hypothetical protein